MSTEAAGQANQEAVDAGREMTAVAVEADEAPEAAGNAGRPEPGRDGSGEPRAAGDEDAELDDDGDDDAEPDQPGVVSTDGAGGADGQHEADGEDAGDSGDEDDEAEDGGDADGGDAGADREAAAAGDPGPDADADEDEDEDAWPDGDGDGDGDLPADGDGGAYDEYGYEDDYQDDGEQGPGDRGTGRARRWPRVLLVTGFVLAAAAIVGGALAIVGSVTHGFKKPVKVTYKKSALFSLKTGDCFDPQGQAYSLTSCDVPHQAEVFATFALTGAKYPGSTAVAAAAGQGCASRLTGYLNPQLAVSLASTYVYPDVTAWQAGTRTVICEVQASSGQLTGSVRGASATAG